MRGRQVVLALALLFAAGLFLFGNRESAPEVSEAVERPGAGVRQNPAELPARITVLPLVERSLLLARHGNTRVSGLFRAQSWAPAQKVPGADASVAKAPPLPFEYLGRQEEAGGWLVFLADQERTLVVRQGDFIGESYRVEKIAPPILTLMYLPLSERQTMTME